MQLFHAILTTTVGSHKTKMTNLIGHQSQAPLHLETLAQVETTPQEMVCILISRFLVYQFRLVIRFDWSIRLSLGMLKDHKHTRYL